MSASITDNCQTNTVKKYGIALSQATVQDITTQNDLTTFAGTCNFELKSANFSGSNRVVPDFKHDITGSIELDSNCETVELESDITLEEVKKEVMSYLAVHENARTSDIVFDLCIDPALVIEALSSLEEGDVIEGKAVTVRAEPKQIENK